MRTGGRPALLLAPLLVLMCGCSASADAPATVGEPDLRSPAEELRDRLADAVEIVDVLDTGGTLTVSFAADTTERRAVALVRAVNAAATDIVFGGHVIAEVENTPEAALAGDMSVLPRWSLAVYPEDADSVAARAERLAEAAAIEQVVAVADQDTGGLPSATIADESAFWETYLAVRATTLFENGGSYRLHDLEQHLEIIDGSTVLTDDLLHGVVELAAEFPAAEVLLQGPADPTLYVSRLTPEEVAAVSVELSEERFAPHEGYRVPFVLGSPGAAYATGELGVGAIE